jgi:hypothetical protein
MTPTYLQHNLSSSEQLYSSGVDTSRSIYHLPVAVAIPAVQTAMPMTSFSTSSYAPLSMNDSLVNTTYQPSEPTEVSGYYSSLGTTDEACGGHDVEMVVIDTSQRGDHDL